MSTNAAENWTDFKFTKAKHTNYNKIMLFLIPYYIIVRATYRRSRHVTVCEWVRA